MAPAFPGRGGVRPRPVVEQRAPGRRRVGPVLAFANPVRRGIPGRRPGDPGTGLCPAGAGFPGPGEGPFLLAYGSGTAPPAQRIDCARLGTAPAAARARQEQRRELGGPAALRPAPEPLPTRRIVLWGVLILGAGLVVAMALALLRKLRQ
ncbi:DUF3999 family protein [Alcanivorax sp. IO_7]|nr:DUF3999 family protein [Alcanivorax sp. IO_7]